MKPHLVEVNISCPNVGRRTGEAFLRALREILRKLQQRSKNLWRRAHAKIPITVKLSPNVENIVEIARACVDSGADADRDEFGRGRNGYKYRNTFADFGNKCGGLTVEC